MTKNNFSEAKPFALRVMKWFATITFVGACTVGSVLLLASGIVFVIHEVGGIVALFLIVGAVLMMSVLEAWEECKEEQEASNKANDNTLS